MDAFLKPSADTDATGVPLELADAAVLRADADEAEAGGRRGVQHQSARRRAGRHARRSREAFPQAYEFPLPRCQGTVVVASTDRQRVRAAELIEAGRGARRAIRRHDSTSRRWRGDCAIEIMAAKQKMTPHSGRRSSRRKAWPARRDDACRGGVAACPERSALKLLVFVAGAVLMGLEIVGSRLLAPYFGNSVFVWGSLISLFLIALSAGYYLGGRLADRRPSQALLNSIVIAVAASMFAIAGDRRTRVRRDRATQAQGVWREVGPVRRLGGAVSAAEHRHGHRLAVCRAAGDAHGGVGGQDGRHALRAVDVRQHRRHDAHDVRAHSHRWAPATILKGLAAALLAAAVATFPFASRRTAACCRGDRGARRGGWRLTRSIRRACYLPPGSKLLVDVDTPYHHISVVDDARRRAATAIRPLHRERRSTSRPPHRSLQRVHGVLSPGVPAAAEDPPRAVHRRRRRRGAADVSHARPRRWRSTWSTSTPRCWSWRSRTSFWTMRRRSSTIAADGRTFVRGAERGAYDCDHPRRILDRRADSVSPRDAGVHQPVPREAGRRRRVCDEHQQRAAGREVADLSLDVQDRSTTVFPDNVARLRAVSALARPRRIRRTSSWSAINSDKPADARRLGRVGRAVSSRRRTSIGPRVEQMLDDLVRDAARSRRTRRCSPTTTRRLKRCRSKCSTGETPAGVCHADC